MFKIFFRIKKYKYMEKNWAAAQDLRYKKAHYTRPEVYKASCSRITIQGPSHTCSRCCRYVQGPVYTRPNVYTDQGTQGARYAMPIIQDLRFTIYKAYTDRCIQGARYTRPKIYCTSSRFVRVRVVIRIKFEGQNNFNKYCRFREVV